MQVKSDPKVPLKGDEKKLLVEKGGGEPGMTPLTVVREQSPPIHCCIDHERGAQSAALYAPS